MKKNTKHLRTNIINKTLFYIYKYIDTNISLEELASLNNLSKYHFHRIFKEETNQTLFNKITSIRLQKASSLLLTNQDSTISQIANMCGYSSHSSFIKAFKNKFIYTPLEYKKFGYKEFSQSILKNQNIDFNKFKYLSPKIKIIDTKYYAYIRHTGYDKSISKTWDKLLAFAYENKLNSSVQIGLHHDNPLLIKHHLCNYVAGFEVEKNFMGSNGISLLEFPKSLCAVFTTSGEYGDIFNIMAYVYHIWLPKSHYEALTLPAYTIYNKNHFINNNKTFEIDFYVPVCLR